MTFPNLGGDFPATRPGWEVDQSSVQKIPFVASLDTESFRGVDFGDLGTGDQLQVLNNLGSDNAYAEEIRARNKNILAQSEETTNPWTKMINEYTKD
jgi:hypothetical protein